MHIQTVLGPIQPDAFGTTLVHEHTFCDLWEWGGRLDYNTIVDDEGLLVDELRCYRDAGGSALVDVTPEGVGRNPAGLRRLAERTGLHVVMGCGWYRERVYPAYVYEMSANQLADRLISELSNGVDASGVRPGIIGELGTERFHITPAEERVFRAAARAQRSVGVTISTHTTHFGELALDQVTLLREEGVPPERIIIGHLGERRDTSDIVSVAATGVFVQIDHVGRPASAGTQPERRRARNVVEVARAGHLEQVLISMDICANSQMHWNGGHGYDYLLKSFVPLLLEEGLTEAEVHAILVDNPRRALAY
jgi:predicted metal-dependent phosphotriesterase family hydrolase